MKTRRTIQYTIRGLTPALDQRIREKATREGQSLNAMTLSLLQHSVGLSATVVRYTDLDDLAGTWVKDSAFDEAVAQLHRVETELWK